MRCATRVTCALVLAACSGDFPEDRDPMPPPTTTPDGFVCAGAASGWTLDPGSDAPLDRDEQAALVDRIVERLPAAEAALPEQPPDQCGDPDAVAHLRGLSTRGEYAACLTYALACTDEAARDPSTVGSLALIGAGCAANESRLEEAGALYQLATAPASIGDCPDARGRAFSHAMFAVTQEGLDVGAILARADGWDPAAAEEAVRVLATGATAVDPDALEDWVADAAAGSDPLLGLVATTTWIGQVDYVLGDSERALRLLDANLGPLAASGRIRSIVIRAFGGLYSRSEGEFTLARDLYAGFVPYTSPRGWLPSEQNVYTYTELRDDACADALLAGDALAAYQALRSGWIAGEVSTADALADVGALIDAEGEHAELLALLGALSEADGEVDGAADAYWRAHELCPYYNRSHWALQQIHLAESLRRGPRLETPPLPAEDALAGYVVNYDSLTEEELAGLRFGLAIWLPYVEDLVATGNTFYAKRPFELLSEAPGAGSLRDERVTYPGDYRLWDDVRGLGGNPVVADITEVVLAPYGAYNLSVHEVAHQVHYAAPEPIAGCIQALYDGAAARDLFVNGYAGLNPEEYFAEGVTYFSVPADTSAWFGTNRKWLLDNDPDLEAFIAEFEATTPLDEVTCPVDVPAGLRRRAPPSWLWRLRHGTAQHGAVAVPGAMRAR